MASPVALFPARYFRFSLTLSSSSRSRISVRCSATMATTSTTIAPAIIVGGGRVGRALQGMGDGRDVLIGRGQQVPFDIDGPIFVCTRNDDLDAVLEATPSSRWSDLVFFQNGMLDPWFESRGLGDANQVLAYFAVSKLGEPPLDGKTDTNPEGLTAAFGKWASAVAARLHSGGLSCKVLQREAFQKQMLEKLIWISAFMLVGARHQGATVGVVEKDYRSEATPLEDKIRESRLRWFGHIKWRPSNDPVRKVDVLNLAYVKKGRGSALSPYLFALVMDVLTRHLQEDVPWCMLFADDIILIDKTREGVEESKGFRLSRSKTKYMECNFSSNRPSEGIVTLDDQVINKSTRFRYLGSIVQSDGEIDGDIISRIQVGWLKWRNASGLLCDRKVPLKLKGKFYKMVVRPAMLYGAECWPLKEKHNSKLSVAEMRMFMWMSGFTLRDMIRNEHIREKVGVAPVEDKIRESRLRWFGHIKWWPFDDPVRKVDVLDLTYVKKGRGRPKNTWLENIRNDLSLLDLNENLTFNMTQWRKKIHVTSLIAELESAAAAERQLTFDDGLEERLCAYSRAVAHFPTAVKEFKWRNGWFYSLTEKAIALGKDDPCPLHTAWLKEIKII
ncbi:hypothetical protein IEQ34_026489 [Dendrobium chrysotoxum]|uniref:Reverse transcriptase domain-containing protein n=1 Tax=Dendrobium chrysotoxum TaxID=161865 RepID=A0AAV7FLS6_DENCH|nr:hypothetical protein IEQ34_026489 [Dendrobium chrysotoxum]